MPSCELEFTFHFDDADKPNTMSVSISPNPNDLPDFVHTLLIASSLRILTKRHGLEHALQMAQNAGYGKLLDGDERFSLEFASNDTYLKFLQQHFDDQDSIVDDQDSIVDDQDSIDDY